MLCVLDGEKRPPLSSPHPQIYKSQRKSVRSGPKQNFEYNIQVLKSRQFFFYQNSKNVPEPIRREDISGACVCTSIELISCSRACSAGQQLFFTEPVLQQSMSIHCKHSVNYILNNSSAKLVKVTKIHDIWLSWIKCGSCRVDIYTYIYILYGTPVV